MPRGNPEDEEIVRVHIWMFKSDAEFIRNVYNATIGFSKATRHLIRREVRYLEKKIASSESAKVTEAAAEAVELPE